MIFHLSKLWTMTLNLKILHFKEMKLLKNKPELEEKISPYLLTRRRDWAHLTVMDFQTLIAKLR